MASETSESAGPFVKPLAATKFLIGLCAVDFAMLVVVGGGLPLGLVGPPASRWAVLGVGGLAGSLGAMQPWRMLSANFVHLSLLHLAMNMVALHSFARSFEDRFDGPRLVITYALTGMAGFWLSSAWYGPMGPTTAGASASLFGLIGVEIAYLVSRRDPMAKEVFFQYLFMAVALAIILPVNNFAHWGGFLAGLPIGALLSRQRFMLRFEPVVRLTARLCSVAFVVSILLCLATLFVAQEHGAAG